MEQRFKEQFLRNYFIKSLCETDIGLRSVGKMSFKLILGEGQTYSIIIQARYR